MKAIWFLMLASMVANAGFSLLWRQSAKMYNPGNVVAMVGTFALILGLGYEYFTWANYMPKQEPRWLIIACTGGLGAFFFLCVGHWYQYSEASRLYPVLAAGTVALVALADKYLGNDPLTLRKGIGILLAIAAIWCIVGGKHTPS